MRNDIMKSETAIYCRKNMKENINQVHGTEE